MASAPVVSAVSPRPCSRSDAVTRLDRSADYQASVVDEMSGRPPADGRSRLRDHLVHQRSASYPRRYLRVTVMPKNVPRRAATVSQPRVIMHSHQYTGA